MNNRRSLLIIGGLVALGVAIPVGWYLLSPLFIDRAVDEAFPTSAAAAPTAAPQETSAPSQPTAAGEEPTADATQAMLEALTETPAVMEEPMPAEDMATMTILAQGEFYDIAHHGEGRATIYQLADGARVLRFEDFEVLNGPDLHIWLVPVDPVPSTVGVEIGGYRDLGPLKGNIGNQNYDLPTDADLTQFKSVVVWCVPFRVPFAAAPLAAP